MIREKVGKRRPDILFLGLDTLPANHVSGYGYPRRTTPNIDQLAKEGVLFEHVYAAGLSTTPSWTSMFTGAHPLSHEIVRHTSPVALDRSFSMLSETLQMHEYNTASVAYSLLLPRRALLRICGVISTIG